jgi:hypothetical protein
MDREVIETENVEYLDSAPGGMGSSSRGVVYQSQGLPCCPGCGCLVILLVLLFHSSLGSILSAILVILVSAWLSAYLLRLAGIHRYSPLYVYLVVPLFLAGLNLVGQLFRGQMLLSWTEVLGGTVLVYGVLFVLGRLHRY